MERNLRRPAGRALELRRVAPDDRQVAGPEPRRVDLDARSGSAPSRRAGRAISDIAIFRPEATLYVPTGTDGSSSSRYARQTSRTSVMSRSAERSPTEQLASARGSRSAIWRVHEPIANRSSRPGPSCWKARATTTSSPTSAPPARRELGGGLRGRVGRLRRGSALPRASASPRRGRRPRPSRQQQPGVGRRPRTASSTLTVPSVFTCHVSASLATSHRPTNCRRDGRSPPGATSRTRASTSSPTRTSPSNGTAVSPSSASRWRPTKPSAPVTRTRPYRSCRPVPARPAAFPRAARAAARGSGSGQRASRSRSSSAGARRG